VQKITLLGVQSPPSSVRIDGVEAPQSVLFNLNTTSSLLEISGLRLPAGQDFEVVWDSFPIAAAGSRIAAS
jgi:hypothetical protein